MVHTMDGECFLVNQIKIWLLNGQTGQLGETIDVLIQSTKFWKIQVSTVE